MRKFILIAACAFWCSAVVVANETVSAVEIPVSLSFAGELVPLSNYDTRESLEREVLVTSFMHSRTMIALLSTQRYFPIIEPILKKNGIPEDFKYLCMAESGLNPNVASGAGAAGLWQIMPAVGKSYGLEVSDVDERYHIEKATEVACKYLNEAYKKLGSWTLAAASYNLGMTGVATRVAKQGTKSYYDTYMPEETMRYMFRILSWKLICSEPHKYGYNILQKDYYHPLTQYREVQVSDKVIDWTAFAITQGTTYKMLRELNHWMRTYEHKNPAGKTYTVRIPLNDVRVR